MASYAAFHEPQIDLLPEQGTPGTTFAPRSGACSARFTPRSRSLSGGGRTATPSHFLIHLTPVGEDGVTPSGESVVVVGKHVSERGIGFYHPKPLPYRRMIASLEGPNGNWFGFLVNLNWCRFTRQGWYESGGRFLESVNSPLEGNPPRETRQ